LANIWDGDGGIMDGIMAFDLDSPMARSETPSGSGRGCFTVTTWPSARLT
jgi:hypothetical protein